MSDLILEYYSRNLTDAEEDALGEELKSSQDQAMRFLEHAIDAYVKTGLPEPKSPNIRVKFAPKAAAPAAAKAGAAAAGGGIKWSLPRLSLPWNAIKTLLLILFAVVFGWLVWRGPEIYGEKVQARPLSLPDEAARPKAPAAQEGSAVPARRTAATVAPQPYVRGKTYAGWAALITKSTPGPVQVRVTDASNRVVRRLYDGTLARGVWVFTWDGRTDAGRMSPPGSYAIEASSGGRVARRAVQIAP